jgi:N-acetylmuramoyl-L-alanine amidase
MGILSEMKFPSRVPCMRIPIHSGVSFMKSLPRPRWFGLLGCAAALISWMIPVTARAAEDFQWQPLRMGGRDYLSAEQIGRFYDLKLRREGGKIVLDDNGKISINLEVGSPVCMMNGLRFILEVVPVTEADSSAQVSRADLSRVLDPVLRPKTIKTDGRLETVILDHGGGDRGTASDRGSAADYTLQIARLAAKELETAGFKVVLTREEDVAVTAEKRLELANAVEGGAVFILIHFGSGGDAKRGIGTAPLSFCKDPPADDELVEGDFGPASMALATAVHASASVLLKPNMVDLGIQPSFDPVFSKLKHPAIFLDVGCLGDPEDAKLIHNEAYQRSLGRTIGQGIRKYRKATEK